MVLDIGIVLDCGPWVPFLALPALDHHVLVPLVAEVEGGHTALLAAGALVLEAKVGDLFARCECGHPVGLALKLEILGSLVASPGRQHSLRGPDA